MTNARKRTLKAEAQRLKPVLKLGQAGLSEGFLKSLDEALSLHGLVKIRFTDFKEDKKILAPQIAERTGSELIHRVGNTAVFWRERSANAAD